MKRIMFGSLVLSIVMVAIAMSQSPRSSAQKHLQIATPGGSNVGIAADNIQRQQPAMHVVQLKGNVEIRTHDMELRTDEAEYNEKTGEIEARGSVHIRLETQN
jgi:lipopolysaccharide assembly outer membrane protein LptD (OstA)